MSVINDIAALFEKIATTYPAIGHDPGSGVYRFYGYNMDESNSGDKNKMTFPRLGLAMKTHAGLSGRIDNTGGSFRNNLFAEVIILSSTKTNDYSGEQAAYDLTYNIMMDIVSWLLNQAVTLGDCGPFPVIGQLDVGNITYARVGPVTQDRAFGWKMTILFKEMMTYKSVNPLNNMTA